MEVELSLFDVSRSREECERSIVSMIYGENAVNFTGLKQTMEMLWCREGSLKVVEIKSKLF